MISLYLLVNSAEWYSRNHHTHYTYERLLPDHSWESFHARSDRRILRHIYGIGLLHVDALHGNDSIHNYQTIFSPPFYFKKSIFLFIFIFFFCQDRAVKNKKQGWKMARQEERVF